MTLIAAQLFALILNPLGLVKLKTLEEIKSNRVTRLPKLSADECCSKLSFICLVWGTIIIAMTPIDYFIEGPFALKTSAYTIRLLGRV